MSVRPVTLSPNQPGDRFYAGGQQIADLRDLPYAGGNVPEDWVGSVTTLFGESELGLTRLETGQLLTDAIAAAPEDWLGAAHVAEWGTDTKLLTKLLDAGERLPVHIHPDGAFARRHLGTRHGKTEAWLILTPGVVYLGFQDDVTSVQLQDWVERQDSTAMLAAMHRIEVGPGDGVFVPARTAHAIGEGVLLVEVQEPEDLSILLEWRGFALAPDAPKDLGLGMELALGVTDRRGLSRGQAESLIVRATQGSALPAVADEFFRADWLGAGPLDQSFGVLVVIEGDGALTWDDDSLRLTRGSVVLVPHCVTAQLTGTLRAAWCRPPAPTRAG